MFSFSAVLLLLPRSGFGDAPDQTAMNNLCDVYYTACVSTCNTYKSNADSSCNSESTNIDYARCFFNYGGSNDYLDDFDFKHLALCMVEETKTNIGDFTCFNNGTEVVDCASQIDANMNFNLVPLNNINAIVQGDNHQSVLTIQWADFPVIYRPIDWDGCEIINDKSTCETPYADYVPHMNLHACKVTAEQKTCSSLMLGSTDANSTVDLSGNNMVNQGTFYPEIVFPSTGTWKLLGHIQIYSEESGVRKKWDIANGIEVTVTPSIPTPFPTIALNNERERGTGGNNTALIVCLVLVAICGGGCAYCYWFGGFGEDSYDDEYEVDEDYDEAADGFVNTGIDDEKGVEMSGKKTGNARQSELTEKPKMDQLATGGIYAKLMANTKQNVSREPTPEPAADLPPAPTPPNNASVV